MERVAASRVRLQPQAGEKNKKTPSATLTAVINDCNLKINWVIMFLESND